MPFQIYVDQSLRQPLDTNQALTNGPDIVMQTAPDENVQGQKVLEPNWPRYIPEVLKPNQRFFFDERKVYPPDGGEFSDEELRLVHWTRRQNELKLRRHCEAMEAEMDDLKTKLEAAYQQVKILTDAFKQIQQTQQMPLHSGRQSPPNNRLSIVPQSLQPAMNNDGDTSVYNGMTEAPSVLHEWWKYTLQPDKFTVPIDQSQYIRENAQTSTPDAKNDKNKHGYRRMSRPSMGGSPTMKLSPITETSRDCNSKSSSSSSGLSTTPGTAVKKPLVLDTVIADEPDRPLDPNDPSTYRKFLRSLAEPIDRRHGFVRVNSRMPSLKNGVCFHAGPTGDDYLIDQEISKESKMYTAQLLNDDPDDLSAKTICFRADQPANDWLFYICNELHRRCVRLKDQPDIELSVLNADPAIFFDDGSILMDEYFRFLTLEEFFTACTQMRRQFPKAVAAYIILELLQLVKAMHSCDIIHMNVAPCNIVISGWPTREDISCVSERTSIVKLIGFDYATDVRLLPCDYKFKTKLHHMVTCDMIDGKAWTFETDWYGVLACIYRMFFLEEMQPVKEDNRWGVAQHFKGFPTNVWSTLFDSLLNIDDMREANEAVDLAINELRTWVKANISFVLKEGLGLENILEEHCKSTNRTLPM